MSAPPARIDFEGIAALALTQAYSLVPSWLPAGKLHGHEYRCGGISGERGESLSVNLNKGLWADFATGDKGGDLISLYAAINRMSQVDAARAVSDLLGQVASAQITATVIPIKQRDKWTAILPVPETAPPPPDSHYEHGKPAHVARYLDSRGALLGLIYRCEPASGKKEVVPLTYCQNAAGRNAWRWQSLPKPRSLYGAELLSKQGRVLVVEGEPKADAARRLLGDDMIVVAWPGGSNATEYVDWSLLSGRDVVIWPDADKAGTDAAAYITVQLRHHNATVRIINPPPNVTKGWDIGDAEREGWTGRDILSHIDPPLSQDFGEWGGSHDPEPETGATDFVPLGHDRGRFYFFTAGGGQVRDFSSRDLQTGGALSELAGLTYWEMNFPGKGDAGFNIRAAGNSLVRACYKAGIYDPERLRGRGAWLDDGRVVLHLGNMLIVDGVPCGIADLSGQFIYEQGKRLALPLGDPGLSSDRASKLIDLCVACPWEDQASMGRLLAGWIVIAPVCGAMPWRPHIWVTGESGSGKSWLVENLIRSLVGDIALAVASKTSEAGVRGDLGLDARPVIFDEFESQNETDRARIQQVLDLARQASSEDGAAIIKGTQTGGSRRYRIRSCFAFSSINLGLQQAADESRTAVLIVKPSQDQDHRAACFAHLQALHAEVVTPEFKKDLLARTLQLLPTIRANAEVFAAAIARSGVPRRTGDTLGVLLAGAWSLRSRKLATPEEVDEYVLSKTWMRTAIGRAEVDPEWRRSLDYLVQIPLRTAISNRNTHQDISVGELINIKTHSADDPITSAADAETTLARAGIRIEVDYTGTPTHVIVASSSEVLRRAFERTPWATGWMATLSRTPGAEKLTKTMKFAALTSRGVRIPIKLAMGENDA